MRSDARKRNVQYTQPHHDPAVCELIREARAEALSEAAEAYGTPGSIATTGYVRGWLLERAERERP